MADTLSLPYVSYGTKLPTIDKMRLVILGLPRILRGDFFSKTQKSVLFRFFVKLELEFYSALPATISFGSSILAANINVRCLPISQYTLGE